VIIKLILITALVLAAVFAYRAGRGARSLAARRMGLTLVMGCGIIAVLTPSIVSRLANLVGVGRGTDLVLYVFVVASLFVWIGLYRRLHEMEERFVDLARQIALGRTTLPDVTADPDLSRDTRSRHSVREQNRVGPAAGQLGE
jgi:small membrane protein